MQLAHPLSSSSPSLPPSFAEWLGKHPSFFFTPCAAIILGAFEAHVAPQFLDYLISNNFSLHFTSARPPFSRDSSSEAIH